ncbi:MAG: HPP family protein [Planctomycetota bacterium]
MYSIVADLMRVRHGNVLSESASLREAAERLILSDSDVLVTTDGAGRLTGVISESCVVRALLSGAAESIEIRGIISHHAPSTTPNVALRNVLPLFRTASVTVVPVVSEAGEVCGLLHRRDVIAALIRSRSEPEETPERPGTVKAVALVASGEPSGAEYSDAVETAGHAVPAVPRWSATGLAGPHFLKGPAAKRVLWPAEDRL